MVVLIGIDSGANGAIAVYSDKLYVHKMPKRPKDLLEIFQLYRHGQRIVYLEKVNPWRSDTDDMRHFNIGKMMANYSMITFACEIENIKYIEVHPKTWQTAFSIRRKESKKDRKNRYKRLAEKVYPEQKAYLWNADAILILHYARMLNERMQT